MRFWNEDFKFGKIKQGNKCIGRKGIHIYNKGRIKDVISDFYTMQTCYIKRRGWSQ